MNENHYQICTRCVMDTSDKYISFDEHGVCNRCREYEQRIEKEWNNGFGHEEELNKLLFDIKKSGEGKEYDCILGLSGGLDSSYMLHLAITEWGLRPFVFHIDAGWNLPIAESNVKKICDKLNINLHVKKLDFDDIRQMQIAFFKTGLAALDVPQDHAFIAQVDYYSEKLGVKYILNGYNICTEIVADPASWGEGGGPTADKVYVKDVLRKHGGYKPKNYIYTTGLKHKFWLPYVKGIKTVQPLNYVHFTKQEMIDTLKTNYDYVPYGQKHFEDSLTKFLEGWWLPTRFGYDIRRAWLSSLIITGQMTREEALEILKTKPLTDKEEKELFDEMLSKLQVSKEELLQFHSLPTKTMKYRNNSWAFSVGVRLYTFLGLDKRIRQ